MKHYIYYGKLFRAWLFLVLYYGLAGFICAEEPTHVELAGTVYGAEADARGPIGGGEGYTNAVTKGDFTVSTVEALLDGLARATAGQVIFIPGTVEIDLTTLIYIDQLVLEVPEGVTLASDRGVDGSPGALLTSDALKTKIMIRILGPGVRITGLRLRGPNPKRYLDHHRRAFSKDGGGHAYYYKFPTQDGIFTKFDALEVDNCDLSGFGHSAVRLAGGCNHRIHHNYIHHCQYNGLGYGISHGVTSSIIAYNRFDANRHSIAGSGNPGCSYIARHNVELGVSLSHCFDMHGGRDREDGTNIAGTAIEIHNNTFLGKARPVAIRGVPEKGCKVYRNWFPKHKSPGEVVRASENTTVSDNAYGSTPPAVQ